MSKQITFQTLPICSRCIVHEINSWIIDKRGAINPETTQKIREELKVIKLKAGECIVCSSNFISDGTCEDIVKILKKDKADEKMMEDFQKDFCLTD